MIKGKINYFTVDDINRIAPELNTSDFVDIAPYYDACEELMMGQGFETWDDDLVFMDEIIVNGVYELRYNIAVVRGIKRNGKFILQSIGISYHHIKNNKMTDLDKLVYARNHLRAHTVNGTPEDDGVKAFEYMDEYIKKMRDAGAKNIKQLLK